MSPVVPLERIDIPPPEWCRRCDAILPGEVLRHADSNWQPLCRDCAALLHPHAFERREAPHRGQRELVNVARQLAWHARHLAQTLPADGRPNTATVLQQLAAETERAIDHLRRV